MEQYQCRPHGVGDCQLSGNIAEVTLFEVPSQQEKKILKQLLLWHFHRYCHVCYQAQCQYDVFYLKNPIMENYIVDNRIIQMMISDIIETDDYTLEGLAQYAHVPVDALIDVACGRNASPSITLWTNIIGLYLQVKPNVFHYFVEKLLGSKEEDKLAAILSVMNDG